VRDHFGGKVNIFVNNAGATSSAEIGDITPKHCQEHLIGNVQTPILIVDELVKQKYFQPESRIIYISSIGSRITQPFQTLYSSTKAAGEALCRTWAEAFGGKEEKVLSAVSCRVGVSELTMYSLRLWLGRRLTLLLLA
jgi:NAD(P)-dependent dehydrogenase (short-subunit alcohol dehydrogenase family)